MQLVSHDILKHAGVLVSAAILLTACGAPSLSDGSQSPASESATTVSQAGIDTCLGSRVITLPSDELEAEKACQLAVPATLSVKFFDAGEPGCRPMVVATAPATDDIRRVQIVSSNSDGKQYRSGLSIQNRVLPDRKSGWVFYGGVMGGAEADCSDLSFTLEDVRCIRGNNPATDYSSCEGIEVDTSGLFKK